MRYHKIPDETVRRLPIYLRGVLNLSEQGYKNVSSRHLAEGLGATPWQIRKDFSYFGDFGTPGVGYDTENLARESPVSSVIVNEYLSYNPVKSASSNPTPEKIVSSLIPRFSIYASYIVAA